MRDRIFPSVGAALYLFGAVLAGSAGNCAGGLGEHSAHGRGWGGSEKEQESYAALSERVRVLEDSLPLLACGPELRALLREVREKCKSKEVTSAAPSKSMDTMCNEKEMKVAIAVAERELETKLIGQKLLTLLRHEVVYPSQDGKISTQRDSRLKSLAEERRLPSTRFLVIAGGVDATQRMDTVMERLRHHGVPERENTSEGDTEKSVERFERPWHYNLGIPLAKLKMVDRPVPPAEAPNLERAVYVFRTDCL